MLRNFTLMIGFLLAANVAFGQLKKSYYGTYVGEIASYEINTGTEKFGVAAAQIEIQLAATTLTIKIGNQETQGTWKVLFEGKAYFVLVGKIDNQLAEERIIVYKKGKKISREGIRPQPNAMLQKVKK